jgi:hypothetical protein
MTTNGILPTSNSHDDDDVAAAAAAEVLTSQRHSQIKRNSCILFDNNSKDDDDTSTCTDISILITHHFTHCQRSKDIIKKVAVPDQPMIMSSRSQKYLM